MGVITISMDNESEKMLRELAKKKYGNKKNAISQTILDALQLQKQKKEEASFRLMKRLEEPIFLKNKKNSLAIRKTKTNKKNKIKLKQIGV